MTKTDFEAWIAKIELSLHDFGTCQRCYSVRKLGFMPCVNKNICGRCFFEIMYGEMPIESE